MTAMIAISILLMAIVLVINVGNIIATKDRIYETLNIISNTQGNYIAMGNLPDGDEKFGFYAPKSKIDIFLSSNFFVVKFDRFDNIVSINASRTQSVTEEDAIALALSHLEDADNIGQDGKFVYVYENTGFSNDTYAIFLDVSDEIANIITIFILSLLGAIAGWCFMLVIVNLLSSKMLKPIALSISKQKEFITNAGHELKTPLAIIQSNTEAMEIFSGESKYSQNIKKQITRLSGLMDEMLILTRMDEKMDRQQIKEFDVSSVLDECVTNFKEAFELKNITVKRISMKRYHSKATKKR